MIPSKVSGCALAVFLLLVGAAFFISTSRAATAAPRTGNDLANNAPWMPIAAPTDTPTPTKTPDSCPLAWSVVASPNPGRSLNELLGVVALSADDVWAVGYQFDHTTLVEHWDGVEWSVVPSPNAGKRYNNQLVAVAGIAATDAASNVWAVGYYHDDDAWQTLVEHWNGTEWSFVPSADAGSKDNFLTSIAVVSADDAWAVGRYYEGDKWQTLVEHWNGIVWSIVSSPNKGESSNELSAVTALSANNVWAVGHFYGPDYVPQTLVEHWDGIEWSIVSSPNKGESSNELSAVTALSANDVWAVGHFYDGSNWRTLAEHWKGSDWQVEQSPNVGGNYNFLSGVTAVADNDVWAAGYYENGAGKYQTLVEHWDGRSWSVVQSPSVGALFDYFDDIVAVESGDVWAVGQTSSIARVGNTLVEHYAPLCVVGSPTVSSPTLTPTNTPSPTNTSTPTDTPGPALLVGHVTWQGPPPQPNGRQSLPISVTLRLQSGGPMEEYDGLMTNPSGLFTVTADIAGGSYDWRVKGPQYLAAAGSAFLARGETKRIEIGVMKTGDCTNDNAVSARDYIAVKNSFGKSIGQQGYDPRADFTGDQAVNALDFTLLKGTFGQGGAPTTFDDLTTPSLLDRARLHTWRDLGALHNTAFRESDITYDVATGKYYVFSTGSYTGTGSVYMYVAEKPEDLVYSTPITVAAGVYPSIVKDPTTGHWHLYAENFLTGAVRHFVSTSTPNSESSFVLQTAPIDFGLVDVQVRKHPTNGRWYAVGFGIGNNQPLTIKWSNGPNGGAEGAWTTLGEVFADGGPPPWASFARPDPNLAFTADGRAWVFFTGNAQSPVFHRPAVVELDLATGRAIGSAVAISAGTGPDPIPGWNNGENLSDLNFVSVPGQPDRIFGFSCDGPGPYINTLDMNWGVMDLDPIVEPSDGRTSADLVRLGTENGFDVAAGIQATLLGESAWSTEGLVVSPGSGGAYSYLNLATMSDFTETVDFTPSSITAGAINEVANIGGHDYTLPPGIDVQIDANGRIVAVVTGSDYATITLDSGTAAQAGTRYSVVVRRMNGDLTLTINGALKATGSFGSVLEDLEQWSLGAQARITQQARYPFSGTVHSFTVITSEN